MGVEMKKLSVYTDREMYNKIRDIAAAEDRSMASQMKRMLNKAIGEYEKITQAGGRRKPPLKKKVVVT